MKTKLLFILISCLFLSVMAQGQGISNATETRMAPQSFEGDGTPESPYQIRTEADLAQLAMNVNAGTAYAGKHFLLLNDLDLAGWDNGDGKGWVSIGNDFFSPFKGIFNGNNQIVRHLACNREMDSYIRLFGLVEEASAIKNLGVEDVDVTGYDYVGGLVGEASSVNISDCFTAMNIKGTFCYTIGTCYFSTLLNHYSDKDILVNGGTVLADGGWNGYGKTKAELQSIAFFTYTGSEKWQGVNWNISTSKDENYTWYLEEGKAFPILQWQQSSRLPTPPAIPINYLKVTLPEVEGVTTDPVPGAYFIVEQGDFSFTVTPDRWHQQDTVVVTDGYLNSTPIELDTDGKYTISDIRQAVNIHNVLKPYREPVGNESLTDGIRIWGADGSLHLLLAQPGKIAVYTVSGQLVRQDAFSAGDHTLPLPSGLYLVQTSSGYTVKVQL